MFCIKIYFLEPEQVRAEISWAAPGPKFVPGVRVKKNILSWTRGKIARLYHTGSRS